MARADMVIPAARAFEAPHPDVAVDMQRIEEDDQAPMLLDGRIDVGHVRLPIDEATGWRQGGAHRGRPGRRTTAPACRPNTQPTKRTHPNAGYRVRGVDETLEHVGAGRGISVLARSASVFYSHPDHEMWQQASDAVSQHS
ncbi:MAG: hypothetical protein ACJ736_22980 [Streptomyces sp.]